MKKVTEIDILTAINNCDSPVGAAYLSNHLNASAATIGRMLKKAEDNGYIRSISNKGRVVTQKGKTLLDSRMTQAEILQNAESVIALAFSEDAKHAKDILEFRRLIEPYAVACATVNATEEDLQEIRDLDFEHRYVVRKGETGSEQNLKMHLKFAELSGNSALFRVLRLLLVENNAYQFFSSMFTKDGVESYSAHEAILEAVYKREPKAAAAAMEKHLNDTITLVTKSMEENANETK